MAVTVLTAAAVAVAPLGLDWLAYAYSFRTLQRAAEQTAVYGLQELVDPAGVQRKPYLAPPYRLSGERPPLSGPFAGRRAAYQVTLVQDWRSPLFGIRHAITTRATAMLLPTDRADEARVAIVE